MAFEDMLHKFYPFSEADSLGVIFRKRIDNDNFICHGLERLYTAADRMFFIVCDNNSADFNHAGGLKSKVLLCRLLKQGVKKKAFRFRKAFTINSKSLTTRHTSEGFYHVDKFDPVSLLILAF